MDHYDTVVIGSGAGGGTIAYVLAKAGKKVLLIERGDFLPREKENWETKAVFLKNRYKTKEVWRDKEGKEIHPGTHYYVGGNTKVYGAALLRLRNEDFGEIKHSGGISPAWPLKYEDFQPYYLQAEKLYKVHGQRGIDPTEPQDSQPFPYPAISHEPRIQRLNDSMKSQGLHPFPLPLGLHLNEEDRENSPCIRCDTCDGFPCLVDAKSDAEISCVKPALALPNFTLLTKAKVLRLETDSSGKRVTQVIVEIKGNKEKITADRFIVSCGAINSAALLLRSDGLANSSGLVGRNYMCHTNTAMVALSTTPNTTHFEKTFGINDFYFGSPDWKYPLGHIQLLGNVKPEMLQGDAPFFTPAFVLEKMAKYAVGWWISSEDLPHPENRVQLGTHDEIILEYTPNNEEGHNRLVKKLKGILSKIEMGVYLAKRIPVDGVAHQVGTCRFGTDPETSVLDVNCKAHDLDNLYVVDGSFFPSSGAVNPALTIIANALRIGDILTKR